MPAAGRTSLALLGASGLIAAVLSSGGTASAATAGVPVGPAPAVTTVAGTFQSVDPTRLLDTRGTIGGHHGVVAGKSNVTVPVPSASGVPSTGVSAVVVNVTVLSAASSGFLQGGATESSHTSSVQNFVAGTGVANEVVLPVTVSGGVEQFDLYNGSAGGIQVVVDVAGYYVSGTPSVAGAFGSVTPARVLDTRASAPLAGRGNLGVQVTGAHDIPSTGVSAVVLNVTALSSKTAGYLAGGVSSTSHTSSILNFGAGQGIANEIVLPVSASGKIDLYNGGGSPVELVADVAGYYRTGTSDLAGAFGAPIPDRLLDTRSSHPIGAAANLAVRATSKAGVPRDGVAAVVLNVTALPTGTAGYLAGGATSNTHTSSISNYPRTGGIANEIVLPVSSNGTVDLFNGGAGPVDVVADVVGYYLDGTAASGLGNDIAQPQCDAGSALPPGQAFGIIGLNQGLPTKDFNSCLGTQVNWAQNSAGGTGQPKAAISINTANPGPVFEGKPVASWPKSNVHDGHTISIPSKYGTCTGTDSAGCAYVYGWSRAYDDYTSNTVANGVTNWWLDVETENSWETTTSRNVADLEAMVTYLQSVGRTVGIYASNYQWKIIAGTVASTSNLSALPNWIAGADTLAEAQANCATPLMRGTVTLTQYLPAPYTLDYDNSCI